MKILAVVWGYAFHRILRYFLFITNQNIDTTYVHKWKEAKKREYHCCRCFEMFEFINNCVYLVEMTRYPPTRASLQKNKPVFCES